MATKFLDKTGLSHFWSKIKAWALATFATITHNHASNAVNAMTGYSKPSSGSAIVTSDSLNNAIGKLEAKVDAIDDSNYVHLTGNESINGTKTFKGLISYPIDTSVHLQGINSEFSLLDGVSSNINTNVINFYDKDLTLSGGIQDMFNTDNSHTVRLFVYRKRQNSSSTGGFNDIGLKTFPSGTGDYAYAPSTPLDITSDRAIITKDYADAKFMHLDLNEVVTGVKTYNINDQFSKSKYTDIVRGTTPSSNHYSYHEFLDKNGNRLGYVGHSYKNTGIVNTYLSISRQDGAQEASLGVGYLANGNTHSWAPVPDNSSNSEEIATTSFVKAQGYLSGIVPIANGGTGSDTRMGAIKSLLNSNLNNPNFIFTLNSTGSAPWSNAGYTSIATLQQVMGVEASNLVHTSGDEQISGLKTFYNNVHISHNSLGAGFVIKQRGITRGGTWKNQRGHYMFYDSVDKPLVDIVHYTYINSNNTNSWYSNLQFVIYAPFSNVDTDSHYLMFGTSGYINTSSWGAIVFIPSADNTVYLGTANNRWKQLYAGTATINTSDERCKDSITSISDEVLDIWENINWKQFYFKDAIAEKGNNARLHSGLIAQDIQKVFFEANLDVSRYGFFCYDEWNEEPEEYDENGRLIKKYTPSGNRYSLRYEEVLCIEAAYQRRKNKILENRISELEKRLAKLEGTI